MRGAGFTWPDFNFKVITCDALRKAIHTRAEAIPQF